VYCISFPVTNNTGRPINDSMSIIARCAVVTPVLKKTLDPSDTTNYRPISNLTFIWKMLERCACDQLNVHLQRHGLIPEHQSAYRRCYSIKTAMLKVLSDAYVAADAGRVTLLSLLDISAAFDTVDHQILVERLRRTYQIKSNQIFFCSRRCKIAQYKEPIQSLEQGHKGL